MKIIKTGSVGGTGDVAQELTAINAFAKTALTEEQAHLISKYKSRVVICYDWDKAGRAATERAIDILTKTGLDVRVLVMSGAKDPDEFIKKYGRDKFAKLIDSALPATEYRLLMTRETYNLEDDRDRVAYIKAAVGQLARMRNAVEREVYAGRIASETGVTSDAILQEAERERKRLIREKKREEERRILDPVSAMMPRDRDARYKNPKSAIAEEALITLASGDVKLALRAAERISGKMFSSPLLGRAFDVCASRARDGLDTDMSAFSEGFSEEETSHIAAVFARNGERSADSLLDLIDIIQGENIKTEAGTSNEALLAAAEFYRKKKGAGGT